MPPRINRSLIGAVLILISGMLLIGIYFAGVLQSSDPYLIPSTFPDAWEVVWTIWWNKQFLAGEGELYHTAFLFHPYGASLFLHATVEGLTLPMTWLLSDISPQRIYAWCCAAAFALNLCSFWLLFGYLTRWHFGAAVLALLFAFLPAWIAHLDAGQLNMLCIFPLAGVLLGLAELSEHSCLSARAGMTLFCSLALLPFLNLYYLYYAYLSIGIFCLSGLLFREKIPIAAWARLFGVSIFALLPGSYKLAHVASLARSATYTPDHDPRKHALDLWNFFWPGPHQEISNYIGSTNFGLNSGESAAYVGLAGLVLCAYAIFQRKGAISAFERFALLCGGTFFLLSLGPTLSSYGQKLFGLPFYDLAQRALPFFPSVPARFKNMALLALFALLASLLWGKERAEQSSPGRSVVIALLLTLLAAEFFPIALRSASVGAPSPALAVVARDDRMHAVLDASQPPQQAMLNQIIHGKPIAGGFLSRRPKLAERKIARNKLLRFGMGEQALDAANLGAAARALEIDALIVPKTAKILERCQNDCPLQIAAGDTAFALFKINNFNHEDRLSSEAQ